MNQKAFTKENSIANPSMSSGKLDVLSLTDQQKLVCGSYCHQYGVLIRVAIFSGISMSELLGLQWSDLDPDHHKLHIRHTFGTGDDGYELRSKSSTRSVSLPSYLFKELADWYEDQQNTLVQYQLVSHSNSVAATLKGYQIVPWLMEYYFDQLLQFCSIPKYSFSILHDSFARNSIEEQQSLARLCRLQDDSYTE